MNPVYPMRTERLVLRPLTASDIDTVVAYRNDPQVAALQDWDLPVTRERVERQVASGWSDISPGESRQIGIERDGELVGDLFCGLDEHGGVAEIGFTLRTEHQGRGYATEAASALVADLFGRLGCHRVFAQLSPANAASQRVLRRVGMHVESFAPKSYWWRGQWDDNLVCAMSVEQWRSRSAGRGPGGGVQVTEVIADLSVPDLDAARSFYVDFLGLSTQEFNLGWVARFTSPQTGASVQVVTQDASGPTNPHLSVKVADVDAAHAEAVERGYEIVLPLRDETWGVRRFFVRAPDGTVVNIVRHRA